jgi:Asp/Glu/Hydantoin racemase
MPALPEPPTPAVGFLHTAEVHVATFEALIDDPAMDGLRTVHIVDETLLADARANGVDDADLRDHTTWALHDLLDEGVDVIVCTCSTIGALAEDLGRDLAVPVLRSDRAMAEAAVATGTRIAVIAAVESTFVPTCALLDDECVRQGRQPTIELRPCLDAWTYWEAGDVDAFHRRIAQHVDELDASFDTVVLAQASMFGAVPLVQDDRNRRVLASPAMAVDAALAQLQRVARTASPRGESS